MKRRDFLKTAAGAIASFPFMENIIKADEMALNSLYWIKNIPSPPFNSRYPNTHLGVDWLLYVMGKQGLKFYRSACKNVVCGPNGLISTNDVILIKVNAQWKYRGCTNSDLVRGLIQRILDHPDIFTGEVVIIENGQGRGSLRCDTSAAYGNTEIHANAINELHSFQYLITHVFNSPFVSEYLLDPIRGIFINENDHVTNGYRIFENVSYPCFTTRAGNRIELKEGLWNGNEHTGAQAS